MITSGNPFNNSTLLNSALVAIAYTTYLATIFVRSFQGVTNSDLYNTGSIAFLARFLLALLMSFPLIMLSFSPPKELIWYDLCYMLLMWSLLGFTVFGCCHWLNIKLGFLNN